MYIKIDHQVVYTTYAVIRELNYTNLEITISTNNELPIWWNFLQDDILSVKSSTYH